MNTIDTIQEPVEDNSSDSDTESDIVELKEDESDKIKVLKMESPSAEIVSENDINALKKMPVAELRALTISKGLCGDASKLNKLELVKMLSKK
jgi:hypothetical protein